MDSRYDTPLNRELASYTPLCANEAINQGAFDKICAGNRQILEKLLQFL